MTPARFREIKEASEADLHVRYKVWFPANQSTPVAKELEPEEDWWPSRCLELVAEVEFLRDVIGSHDGLYEYLGDLSGVELGRWTCRFCRATRIEIGDDFLPAKHQESCVGFTAEGRVRWSDDPRPT